MRKQAIERFRLKPDRVVATPEAAAPWFRPTPAAARNPYFLFVGTLEPRKNIDRLIEAWREVRRQHAIDLVLAGRRREDFPPLAGEPGLRILGEVPDAALPDSRASFRAGLATLMASGAKTKDGRSPRLGTAVSGDYWEVFSPGEGHIVQVGRISLT